MQELNTFKDNAREMLKTRAKKLGTSQKRLLLDNGMTPSDFYNLLRGTKHRPRLDSLVKIARVCGITHNTFWKMWLPAMD